MSNTIQSLTTHTETPKTSSTKSISSTEGNYTEATTNITTTFEETTSSIPVSTTSDNDHSQSPTKDDDSGHVGAIVGGVFGAVIFIALVIVIIIFLIRRRKKKRSMKQVPKPPPGKDLLDTLHEENAIRYHRENNTQDQENQVVKQYVNLTPEGETDEQTDPSVGADGYLKKTKKLIKGKKNKKPKKHHHNAKAKPNKAHERSNDLGSNELPIYTNEVSENGKEPVRRTTSVPYNEAPPPPRQSSEYATGRIPRNGQSVDVPSNDEYVNLSGQKGDAVFEVSPTKTNGTKVTTHSSGERNKKPKNDSGTDTEVTDQPQKIYENINGASYYNLKDNQPRAIQSTYEDVGEEPGVALQQDDVYENP